MRQVALAKAAGCGDTAQHGTAQHGTARHGTAQHGTAQHGTAQHGTAQHNTSYQAQHMVACKDWKATWQLLCSGQHSVQHMYRPICTLRPAVALPMFLHRYHLCNHRTHKITEATSLLLAVMTMLSTDGTQYTCVGQSTTLCACRSPDAVTLC